MNVTLLEQEAMELVHRSPRPAPSPSAAWRCCVPKYFAVKLKNADLPQQFDLEPVELRRHVLLVRRDAAAAVDRAAAVGHLHVVRILRVDVLAVVVVEERHAGVVALDQAAARRVVLAVVSARPVFSDSG